MIEKRTFGNDEQARKYSSVGDKQSKDAKTFIHQFVTDKSPDFAGEVAGGLRVELQIQVALVVLPIEEKRNNGNKNQQTRKYQTHAGNQTIAVIELKIRFFNAFFLICRFLFCHELMRIIQTSKIGKKIGI